MGYEARLACVQMLCYVVGGLMLPSSLVRSKQGQGRPAGTRAIALAAATGLLGLLWAQDVRAEFKVRSPNIDYREIEIEHNLSVTFDKRADKNHDISSPVEVGVGLLPFWKLNSRARSNAIPAKIRSGKPPPSRTISC